MEYPILDVPMLGGSLLIAGMAIFHAFIAHFSVGSGFLMAWGERRAIRDGDTGLRSALRRYGFGVLLVPYVLGTVTGVGIWFTIALVSPRAVSLLIHQFVWDWAIEWVFFLVEGTAIFVYVLLWDRLEARTHNRVGWVFAITSLLTLFVINAILSFMLTTGTWQPGAAGTLNWRGILNPTYLPTSLARVCVSLALAGVAGVVLAALDPKLTDAARRRLTRISYGFMVPMVLVPPLAVWTWSRLSQRARDFLDGGAPAMVLFLGFGVACATILFLAAMVALWRKDDRPGTVGAIAMCLVAFVAFGAMEFVREGVRKPYVVEGFMYSTGLTVADARDVDPDYTIERTQRDGLLPAAVWALPPGRSVEELSTVERGRCVYRAACKRCHEIEGYNALRPLVNGWSRETIREVLDRMDEIKPSMPPFPGNERDKADLTEMLAELSGAPPDGRMTRAGPEAPLPAAATARGDR